MDFQPFASMSKSCLYLAQGKTHSPSKQVTSYLTYHPHITVPSSLPLIILTQLPLLTVAVKSS